MGGAVAEFTLLRQGYGKDTADEKIRRVRAHIHSEERFQRLYSNLFTPGLGAYELAEEDTLICRCEGVTLKKLRQMAEESTGTSQEIKNGSRVSMGECQGRMCGHMAMNTLARLTGKNVQEIGFCQRLRVPNPYQDLLGYRARNRNSALENLKDAGFQKESSIFFMCRLSNVRPIIPSPLSFFGRRCSIYLKSW